MNLESLSTQSLNNLHKTELTKFRELDKESDDAGVKRDQLDIEIFDLKAEWDEVENRIGELFDELEAQEWTLELIDEEIERREREGVLWHTQSELEEAGQTVFEWETPGEISSSQIV